MPLFTPTAAVSKFALLPLPLTRVTPGGLPFNPVRVVAVVPSKVLSPPAANTSMYSVSVAPWVSVNLLV